MITIVDYKMGNLGSIANMLKKIGVPSKITSDISEIRAAEKLILPGVGSFDAAMKNLEEMNLKDVLSQKALQDRTPILGICLGVQLMTRRSDEGRLPGLGWFDAEVKKFEFDFERGLKVPHMGWNLALPAKPNLLIEQDERPPRFYFVHSYYIRPNDPTDTLTSTTYGVSFASGLMKDNLAGVQFHPEKSHRFGMSLLHNFATRF